MATSSLIVRERLPATVAAVQPAAPGADIGGSPGINFPVDQVLRRCHLQAGARGETQAGQDPGVPGSGLAAIGGVPVGAGPAPGVVAPGNGQDESRAVPPQCYYPAYPPDKGFTVAIAPELEGAKEVMGPDSYQDSLRASRETRKPDWRRARRT